MDFKRIINNDLNRVPYYITYMWNSKYNANKYTYETKTNTKNRLTVAKGRMREGRTGSLGLADANYYIWDG